MTLRLSTLEQRLEKVPSQHVPAVQQQQISQGAVPNQTSSLPRPPYSSRGALVAPPTPCDQRSPLQQSPLGSQIGGGRGGGGGLSSTLVSQRSSDVRAISNEGGVYSQPQAEQYVASPSEVAAKNEQQRLTQERLRLEAEEEERKRREEEVGLFVKRRGT